MSIERNEEIRMRTGSNSVTCRILGTRNVLFVEHTSDFVDLK